MHRKNMITSQPNQPKAAVSAPKNATTDAFKVLI